VAALGKGSRPEEEVQEKSLNEVVDALEARIEKAFKIAADQHESSSSAKLKDKKQELAKKLEDLTKLQDRLKALHALQAGASPESSTSTESTKTESTDEATVAAVSAIFRKTAGEDAASAFEEMLKSALIGDAPAASGAEAAPEVAALGQDGTGLLSSQTVPKTESATSRMKRVFEQSTAGTGPAVAQEKQTSTNPMAALAVEEK